MQLKGVVDVPAAPEGPATTRAAPEGPATPRIQYTDKQFCKIMDTTVKAVRKGGDTG